MVNRPTDKIQDTDTRLGVESLQQEKMPNPIEDELSAAPTASDPLLNANEWGFYGSELYLRIGNTIFKMTADSTITVT